MRKSDRVPGVWLLLAATVVTALSGAACVPATTATSTPSPQEDLAAIEATVEVPESPPEDLARILTEASQQSMQLAEKAASGDRDRKSSRELKLQILTGVQAAERLLAHADADPEQKQNVVRQKLSLLYLGTHHDPVAFSPRFNEFVERLVEEDPQGETAALAAALRLEREYASKNLPPEEVLPPLVDYAKSYPGNPAGIELFRVYGQNLAARSDREGEKACYRCALAFYADVPEIRPLQLRLREIEQLEARQTAKAKERQAARSARDADIRRRLPAQRDGYFVMYAEENVAPPRHGGMYFYHYQYEVLAGLDAAVSYADGLPEKWSWRLVQRFPQTPEGRENAYALWKKLLHEKRYGKKSVAANRGA